MTDWTDRYDPELGQWMLRDRTAAEGTGTGVPDYLGIRFTDVPRLASSVTITVPRGTWPATLEFKLNYLAPTRPGILRATATVVSMSSRTAVVAVECDNDGRPVGSALGTIALTPPKSSG